MSPNSKPSQLHPFNEHARRLQGCGKINLAIENSDLPPSDAPVIYRASRYHWCFVALGFVFIAWLLWVATAPHLLSLDALSAADIEKNRVENNALLIWMAFAGFVVYTLVQFALIWELVLYRVIINADGLYRRRFVESRRIGWSQITDCVMLNSTLGHVEIEGQDNLDFNTNNPAWLAVRDFIAARVTLPDGLEAWRLKKSLDDAGRRALLVEADANAPIVQHSDAWGFAIIGAMLCAAIIALMFSPRSDRVVGAIVLLLLFGGAVCWPLFYAWRNFIRCDDDGLTVGTIAGQRRIAWSEIEEFFALPPHHKSSGFVRPCIVVNGETMPLPVIGKKRWALMNRVEARAVKARSRRFETREFAPVGRDLVLPATLHYRDAWRDWQRGSASIGGVLVAAIAAVGWTIGSVGWSNFDRSRGLLMVFGAGIAVAVGVWAKRALQRRAIVRARAAEQIEVDEWGLRWRAGAAIVEIAWPDIARLERDAHSLFGFITLRIESDQSSISFSALLGRGEALRHLLRERSGLVWEDSPRLWRHWRGVTRENGVLTVRANTPSGRLCAWMLAGVWAALPMTMISTSIFDEQWSLASWWPGALFFVAPPLGVLLWWALAIWVSAWRCVTRCDDVGLIHRGWLAPRRMNWDEIEEFGTRSELYDWVRARDGRLIKLSLRPLPAVDKGREVLRAEIKSRAPQARGFWLPEKSAVSQF